MLKNFSIHIFEPLIKICLPLGQIFGRALPVGQYDPVGHTKAVGAPVVWPSGQ